MEVSGHTQGRRLCGGVTHLPSSVPVVVPLVQ